MEVVQGFGSSNDLIMCRFSIASHFFLREKSSEIFSYEKIPKGLPPRPHAADTPPILGGEISVRLLALGLPRYFILIVTSDEKGYHNIFPS